MKNATRAANLLAAVLVFNFWLLLVWQYDKAQYYALRAAGAEWFTCIEWDDAGRSVPSTACTEPPPSFDPEDAQ